MMTKALARKKRPIFFITCMRRLDAYKQDSIFWDTGCRKGHPSCMQVHQPHKMAGNGHLSGPTFLRQCCGTQERVSSSHRLEQGNSLEPPDEVLQGLERSGQQEVLREEAAELINRGIQAGHNLWGLLVAAHRGSHT